jgi:hypothetical protein
MSTQILLENGESATNLSYSFKDFDYTGRVFFLNSIKKVEVIEDYINHKNERVLIVREINQDIPEKKYLTE